MIQVPERATFENGVAGDLELDYGDFVIAGRLRSLEELPTPVCTE